MRDGDEIDFENGIKVNWGMIEKKKKVDVVMIEKKGKGKKVRGEYKKGGGVKWIIEINKDEYGNENDMEI